MSDKKLDLIAQLLAKAESTTPAEAEALVEHAERLMIKYGIEQAQIDARRAEAGQASEKIIKRGIEFRGTYRNGVALGLGASVGYALDTVKLLQSKWVDSTTLYLIGFESDVAQAEILIRSLEVQAIIAMRAWWKENRSAFHYHTDYQKQAARDEFIRGFGSGAAARIRESRRVIVEESGSGAELVLVDRRAQVDEFFESLNAGKGRRSSRRGYGTFTQGSAAGRKANTGGSAIGARKAIG